MAPAERSARERRDTRRRYLSALASSLAIHGALLSLLLAASSPDSLFRSVGADAPLGVLVAYGADGPGDPPAAGPAHRGGVGGAGPAWAGDASSSHSRDDGGKVLGETAPRTEYAAPKAEVSEPSEGTAAATANAGAAPAAPGSKSQASGPAMSGDAIVGRPGDPSSGAGSSGGQGSPFPGAASASSPRGGGDGAWEGGASAEARAIAAKIRGAIEARKTYPEAARRRGSEGSVKLKIRVAEDGSLLGVDLARSSGSSILDRAATELAVSVFPIANAARRRLDMELSVDYALSP